MCGKRFCLILLLALLFSPWAAYSEPPLASESQSPSFETLRQLLRSIEIEAMLSSEELMLLQADLKLASDELSRSQIEIQRLYSSLEAASKSSTTWKTIAVVLAILSIGLVVVR